MKDINFGFINIDKPIGPTSFSVTKFIQKELGIKKASHLGTLDPKVTGVLPIALERACKLSGFLIHHDKTYVGILHTHKEQNIDYLQKLIDENFVGKITQIPPHKSAVKRAPRLREVYQWELLESSSNNKDFLFITKVEGGTYIRKLCSDLGEKIGGAHMDELRRIKAGIFDENKIYSLYEFQDALKEYKNGNEERLLSMLQSVEEIVEKNFRIIYVKESSVKNLKTGKKIKAEDIINLEEFNKIEENSLFGVFYGNNFLEMATKTQNKEFVANPMFVYN